MQFTRLQWYTLIELDDKSFGPSQMQGYTQVVGRKKGFLIASEDHRLHERLRRCTVTEGGEVHHQFHRGSDWEGEISWNCPVVYVPLRLGYLLRDGTQTACGHGDVGHLLFNKKYSLENEFVCICIWIRQDHATPGIYRKWPHIVLFKLVRNSFLRKIAWKFSMILLLHCFSE